MSIDGKEKSMLDEYRSQLMSRWDEAAKNLTEELKNTLLTEQLRPAKLIVVGGENYFPPKAYEQIASTGFYPIVAEVMTREREEALNEDEMPVFRSVSVVIRPDRKEILFVKEDNQNVIREDRDRFQRYADAIIKILISLGYQDIRVEIDDMLRKKQLYYFNHPTQEIKDGARDQFAGASGYPSAADTAFSYGSVAATAARQEIEMELLTRK